MTISLSVENKELIVGRVSGELKVSEQDSAKQQVFDHIQQHGRVSVLILIDADFAGLEADADWHDDERDSFIQQQVDHLAIVGQPYLQEDAILFLLGGLMPFPVKYFDAAHADLARQWLLLSREHKVADAGV